MESIPVMTGCISTGKLKPKVAACESSELVVYVEDESKFSNGK